MRWSRFCDFCRFRPSRNGGKRLDPENLRPQGIGQKERTLWRYFPNYQNLLYPHRWKWMNRATVIQKQTTGSHSVSPMVPERNPILFRKAPSEIARAGAGASTICGYLIEFIRAKISPIHPAGSRENPANYRGDEMENERLKPIFEKLNGSASYDEIA